MELAIQSFAYFVPHLSVDITRKPAAISKAQNDHFPPKKDKMTFYSASFIAYFLPLQSSPLTPKDITSTSEA